MCLFAISERRQSEQGSSWPGTHRHCCTSVVSASEEVSEGKHSDTVLAFLMLIADVDKSIKLASWGGIPY